MSARLNLGSGSEWHKPGWTTLDHRASRYGGGSAWRIGYDDAAFDLVFSSHMLEHIPHLKIDAVLAECNRVLRPGGGIRLLCPDLETVARAYVAGDDFARARFRDEDPTIRTDLGPGGELMNFIVSPGQDSLLLSSDGDCIGGYAHIYAYDFAMLSALLTRHGFGEIKRCAFQESRYPELREPLHPVNAPPEWRNERDWADCRGGLTGFDRDPLTSLIVEAIKKEEDRTVTAGFGTAGVRGLDPRRLRWWPITRAYVHFTLVKLRISTRSERSRIFSRAIASLRGSVSHHMSAELKRAIRRHLGCN